MGTDTLGRAVIGGLCKSLEIDPDKRGAVSRLSEKTEIPYRTLHAWLKDGKSPSAAGAAELGDRFGLIYLRHPGGRWIVMVQAPEGAANSGASHALRGMSTSDDGPPPSRVGDPASARDSSSSEAE